jgi:murein L,D-transpeptidase YcbB/YkuD
MDFITIAKLAMQLLGNKDLFDKVKDVIPTHPEPISKHKPGSVRWLQDELNQLMDAGLEVDGDYGPATKAAVAEYQRSVDGLEVDGWAGPQTVASLVVDAEKGRALRT